MTAPLHTEYHFEQEIVEHLTAHGWLEGRSAGYDAARALYPEDVYGWVAESQPKAWAKLVAQEGSEEAARTRLLDETEKQLAARGTLDVLRNGFKDRGVLIELACFAPATGLNEEVSQKHARVRCRIVRQVHFSPWRPKESIDLVAFVNGLPVATLELKTSGTQSVYNAIEQYRHDRPPVDPATKGVEPLLRFKSRCVVHFAVSTEAVYMTTRLEGPATRFLPFNLGHEDGPGNPPNPVGSRTSYLWERVLERGAWLHLLHRFAHLEKKERINSRTGRTELVESLIFPRFHQWDAVLAIIAHAKAHGAGKKYLVQHSAGSGKSNSIAWLAHHLSDLHDAEDRRVFDTVVIVTDRTVLDSQLQETVYQFQRTHGVVERITDKDGAKSTKLASALAGGKSIVIVTLQTFGHVLQKLAEDDGLRTRRFAVIADEAHTSQTGASARKLRAALASEKGGAPAADPEDAEEISAEEVLLAQMATRRTPKNVSYFAFTATPKAKTLELFGTRARDGKFYPFHSYTMSQAIGEGFILDVLKNYTGYQVAWQLAQALEKPDAQIEIVEEEKARKDLLRWVKLHPTAIRQKVNVILGHFRRSVMWRLDGKARAMVVCSSRLEAARFKKAFDEAIAEERLPLGVLVAFSGELNAPDLGVGKVTERSLNGKGDREPAELFKEDGEHLLVVANKYQTGFDQPLLSAMYVNKALAGVAAVQTLSRLNRTTKGKTETFVLDFVNRPEDILAAFQQYHKEARLNAATDPNLIHTLEAELDAFGIYNRDEVDGFIEFILSPAPGKKSETLRGLLSRHTDRFSSRLLRAREVGDTKEIDALEGFVKKLAAFRSAYDFLSQITDYDDTDLEKRYVFFGELIGHLRDILRVGPEARLDLSNLVLTHHAVRRRQHDALALVGETPEMKPGNAVGSGKARDKTTAALAEIIAKLNAIFEGDLTDDDKLSFARTLCSKLMENEELAMQAAKNTREQFGDGSVDKVMRRTIRTQAKANDRMATQLLENDDKLHQFIRLMVDMLYDGFVKRAKVSRMGGDA